MTPPSWRDRQPRLERLESLFESRGLLRRIALFDVQLGRASAVDLGYWELVEVNVRIVVKQQGFACASIKIEVHLRSTQPMDAFIQFPLFHYLIKRKQKDGIVSYGNILIYLNYFFIPSTRLI